MTKTRICTKCKKEKPLTEFYKHSAGGFQGSCKSCHAEYRRQRRKEHPEIVRANDRRYKAKHPIKHKQRNAAWRKAHPDYARQYRFHAKYGITENYYNDIFVEQGGSCAICGTHQSKIEKKLCVDHCHETGLIRGLLCNNCNTALGLMKDDINVMKDAITYLQRRLE